MRVLITGANRGIGLGLAKLFAARGDEVYAGVRKKTNIETMAALQEKMHLLELDVGSQTSVDALVKQVSDVRFDILVNNAGVGEFSEGIEDLDFIKGEEILRINSLGPMRVTQALGGNLQRPGARVVNISSRMGSIADNTSGGSTLYRMSKAALNMGTKSLAVEWKSEGICVATLHPGWVQTDMGGTGAPTSVEESTQGLLKVIDSLTMQHTGQFLDFRGEAIPW